jgi:hypothetical protein
MSKVWVVLATVVVLSVSIREDALAQASSSLDAQADVWKCDETSCAQEFEFLFIDALGDGGVGRVALLVEKNAALFRVPAIGFYEEHYGGLGDQWRASAWIAATFAALNGYDMTRRVTYTVSQPIQGPSASAALTVALLAALEKPPTKLRSGVVMTGAINPDGTIGAVDGIPAKVRAAGSYGKDVVLIPRGQLDQDVLAARDEINGRRSQQNRSPITVLEVHNLAQAYLEYTGKRVSIDRAPVDTLGAGELREPLATAIRQRVALRIAHAEALEAAWKAEPKQSLVDAVGVAEMGVQSLARAKAQVSATPGAAYDLVLQAVEALLSAVACSRDARNDRTAITIGDPKDVPRAIEQVIRAVKSDRPSSPTELSMIAELGGMVELYKQYLAQQDEARDRYVVSQQGADLVSPAAQQDVSEARLALHQAGGRAVAIALRAADYLAVWQSVRGSIQAQPVSEEAVKALRRLLAVSTEANLGYFESLNDCRSGRGGDGCRRGQLLVGYPELSRMRDELRPSLGPVRLDPPMERVFLALSLETYLWSSILIHPSYRGLLVKSSPGTATAGTRAASGDPRALLEWARREAAQTVEHVDKTGPRALLPRLYMQMGDLLWMSPNVADQLRALQFFWRASTHGRLMLTIDGLPPAP